MSPVKGPLGGLWDIGVFPLCHHCPPPEHQGSQPHPHPRQGPSGPLFPGDRCLGQAMTPLNALVLIGVFAINLVRLGKGIRVGAKMKSCLRFGKSREATKAMAGIPLMTKPRSPQKTSMDKAPARSVQLCSYCTGTGSVHEGQPRDGRSRGREVSYSIMDMN